MRLLLPSLGLFLYILLSLVLPLPCRPLGKAAAGLVVLAACLKYQAYQVLGGSFLAPALPRPLLLAMEALYGAVLVLCVLLLLKDGLALLLWLGRLAGGAWSLPFSLAARGAGLAALALALGAWGTWQSVQVPGVRTVEIPVPALPAKLDGFSVVQLSDLHIGPILRGDWLRAVVEKANALHPDAVALTGDLVDDLPAAIGRDLEPLGELRAAHGVFGVTGNHEYYFQWEQWRPVLARLGVAMLHNEHRVLSAPGGEVVIAGVPDIQEGRFGGEGPDAGKALAGAPDAVRILLDHRPGGRWAGSGAQVQLSGHTHGGTMVFLRPLIASYNGGQTSGLYDMGGLQLYVSPGTGIWGGFSCRLGVPAEITRVVLRRRAS